MEMMCDSEDSSSVDAPQFQFKSSSTGQKVGCLCQSFLSHVQSEEDKLFISVMSKK
jgi:hypothetical protein